VSGSPSGPEGSEPDDGSAISYKVLRRGTPVLSADGERLGTVRRVHEATRENIFDGVDVTTSVGLRFLDAPEVARITERAVTTTFPAAEAPKQLADRGSATARALRNTATARRARRTRERLRDLWDRW
jgi:hypothetical protein